jgi:hypothetical protein
MYRRSLIRSAAAAGLLPGAARAQSFPSKPLRLPSAGRQAGSIWRRCRATGGWRTGRRAPARWWRWARARDCRCRRWCGLRTERAQLLRERLAGLVTPTGNDHFLAFLGKGDGGGAPDAGQSAGDQDNGIAHGPVLASTQAEAAVHIAHETEVWKKVIADAGIRLD